MGVGNYAQGLILALVMASTWAANGEEERLGTRPGLNDSDCKWGSGGHHAGTPQTPGEPRRITVGGLDHKWNTFGFNYARWALNLTLHQNDTLVFQYKLPTKDTHPHSVYMFKHWDYLSFTDCNLTNAKMVADQTQGADAGFEFVLDQAATPYLFACGERGGLHCSTGLMRFMVVPLPHDCGVPTQHGPHGRRMLA
ncbi:uncharacterized protein LOC131155688 [Malania oleifera]|uniref:uncharacterized protein LOC131155688 n=1 Tax=Malania oleifera TaxID=397392 RepID=UPI0025AEA71C|nr:uncharacterized protein LOC131155688 [Malania oleifera]